VEKQKILEREDHDWTENEFHESELIPPHTNSSYHAKVLDEALTLSRYIVLVMG
jgi:hypothetical protein